MTTPDYSFKIVIIGDSGVGKSSVLLRFADGSWKDNYAATIGVDFRFKTIKIENKIVKLKIWDTAGHERFRSISSSYFRGCDGAILCYDICNKKSFQNIMVHLQELQAKSEKNCAKILIGNKVDMETSREVDRDDAVVASISLHIPFFEISAKSNENIRNAFTKLVMECIANSNEEEMRQSLFAEELTQLDKRTSVESNKLSFKQIKEGFKNAVGCC
eukprot:330286_1